MSQVATPPPQLFCNTFFLLILWKSPLSLNGIRDLAQKVSSAGYLLPCVLKTHLASTIRLSMVRSFFFFSFFSSCVLLAHRLLDILLNFYFYPVTTLPCLLAICLDSGLPALQTLLI